MKTGNEPELPGLAVSPKEEPLSLRPIAGREQPAVWVSKLAVFQDWPPSKDTLLREIKLHRGLNILWAKPTGSTAEASRLAGHGAGKTTFCRLIRFVLGEKTPGTPQFREAFRGKFGNGWVLAEVFLNGDVWLVGRPLSDTGYHPFARKGGSLADEFPKSPSRAGFSDYEAALDAAVFGTMTLRTLAESGENLDWLRLMTWLTRDQEAHFSGLLEWRHKDSDTKSPDMSHDDRANLIRLVLGLVEKEEQDSLAKFAAKSQAHEQKTRDRGKMEFAVERERLKLEGALGMKVAKPDDPLLRQEVERRVAELKSKTNPEAAATRHEQEISTLLTAVSQREAEYGLINAMVEEWQEAVDLEEARLAGTPPPKPKPKTPSSYRTFLNNVGPFPGYCSHPLNKAWREECPIADQRPKDDDEVTLAVNATQSEAKPAVSKMASLKKELDRRQKLAAPRKLALGKAQGELVAARARQKKELEALNAPWEESKRISGLLVAYQTACVELDKWDEDLNGLKIEKEALSKYLDDLTDQHKKLVNHFGQLFNHLVRHMLGDVVTGSVRFAGKSIVPELEYHGPRDSAAFKVVRWLVFDLAALALGLTDAKAHHPRFLIHDSPREADLAAPIYVMLFTAARALENETGTDHGFQYIVTTTEAPPPELNQSPWILDPVLDASIPEKRLLGVDL
jgi:hypothetical protein